MIHRSSWPHKAELLVGISGLVLITAVAVGGVMGWYSLRTTELASAIIIGMYGLIMHRVVRKKPGSNDVADGMDGQNAKRNRRVQIIARMLFVGVSLWIALTLLKWILG